MKYQVSFHETKHDISTPENYMLFSHVERSLLLWSHVKSHLSQKSTKVKWFGYLWYLYNKIRTFHIIIDSWRFKCSVFFNRRRD